MRAKGIPPRENRPERPTLAERLGPFGKVGLARAQRPARFWAGMFTAAVHLTAFAAFFWLHATRPPVRHPPPVVPITISLEVQPKPPDPPQPEKVEADPQPAVQRKPPRRALPVPVPAVVTPDTSDLLSESQLAGASSADGEGGGGGGSCDTARAVQKALRNDSLVHVAVEGANRLGKAVMLWNGDWVRTGGQDGKGLSAVREAIVWELAFEPEACRNARVHGLVLLSLADGTTRFAIGSADWRWSDLLGVHGTSVER